MPTYEYLCTDCAHQWEELQKISEPALDTCPKCTHKTAKRQISGGSFILKGGGWYADLYSSSPKPAGGGGATESKAAASSTSSTSSSSESKSTSTSTSSAPAKTSGDKSS